MSGQELRSLVQDDEVALVAENSEFRPADVEEIELSVPKRLPKLTRLWEVIRLFALFSVISFGGPQAHIALMQKMFVEERHWISETMFAEILALTQSVPGPSSSQMVFAMGATRAGWLGGCLAYILFVIPGFVVMVVLGSLSNIFLGAGFVPPFWLNGIEVGLSVAAITLVGSAGVSLGKKLCTTRMTQILCVISICVPVLFSFWWLFPALLFVCGVVSVLWLTFRKTDPMNNPTSSATVQAKKESEIILYLDYGKVAGAVLLLSTLVILVGLVILSNFVFPTNSTLKVVEVFYRVGSLVFGGGQVVVPMLVSELVDTQFITNQQFLDGFAAVQMLPGPVFNMSAYLGAVIAGVPFALLCWLCLNLPGQILIAGTLPFWSTFRTIPLLQKVLVGLNASAVGLIGGAFLLLWFKVIGLSHYRVFIAIVVWGMQIVFESVNIKPQWIILTGGCLGVLTATILHFAAGVVL